MSHWRASSVVGRLYININARRELRSHKSYSGIIQISGGQPGETDSSDAKRTALVHRYQFTTILRTIAWRTFCFSHAVPTRIYINVYTRLLNDIPTLPATRFHWIFFTRARPKSKIVFRPTIFPVHVQYIRTLLFFSKCARYDDDAGRLNFLRKRTDGRFLNYTSSY